MNIKRIGLLTFFLLFLIPISAFAEIVSTPEPHDYRNGLLDDPYIIKKNTLPKETYDNDLTTFTSREDMLKDILEIEFIHPVNINGIYLYAYSSVSHNFITIYYFEDDEVKEYKYTGKKTIKEYITLDYKNVFKIELDSRKALYEIDFFGSYNKNDEIPTIPENVENVEYQTTENSISLNYDLPDEFDHIEIDVNGQTYETTENSYTISDLDDDTTYNITIKTVLNEIKSDGITIEAKTKEKEEPPPEKPEDLQNVTDLEIETTYDRVDLSWKNPNTKYYDYTKIYRKDLESKRTTFNIFSAKTVYADGYDPIFETNGTYFADLSIEPEQEYEYKLTTVYENLESSGVTVKTATPKPPIVEIDGKLPFTVEDLLKSGNGLFYLTAPFLLLALAFLLVPRLRELMINSFRSPVTTNGNYTRIEREQRIPRQPREQRQPRLYMREQREPRQPRTPREFR